MKTKGKAWQLVVTALLIVVFVYTAFFGVAAKYGDVTTTYIKGAKDIRFGVDIKGGVNVTFVPSDGYDATDEQLDAARLVIENRLVALNVTDYELYVDNNSDSLILEFPWQSGETDFDPESAIQEIGTTAYLTFREGASKDGELILDGSMVESASAQYGAVSNGGSSEYYVALKFTTEGAKAFGDATTKLAADKGSISIWLDDENVSTATVNTAITDGQAIITSSASNPFTQDAVVKMARQINSGALPFALSVDSYSTVFYDVFDTVTQVIAYCDNEEEFTAQMDALHADLVEYNQLYDIYNDYDGLTNIKTINDNAGTAPVTVDDKILGMLELAQTMYDTTGGKLNIALGSVLNIWHNYREAALADDNDSNNQLPTQEELDAAAQHCDIANLIIDEDAKTVYLADPAMSLDVGSVGKGYAVEQAAQAAEARGLTSALISVGGNLRAIGTKPDGSQWVGGVENPWNSSEVYTNGSSTVAAVKMSDLSLVTSGDYQRYYVVDGVRYHHLIDPATLWPAAYFDGVSVLAPDSGVADCLTTGLFCLPLEEGKQLVESLDGVEALWCTTDGEVVTSSGWSEHTN